MTAESADSRQAFRLEKKWESTKLSMIVWFAGSTLLELDAHADATIAPRDATLPRRRRVSSQAVRKRDLDLGAAVERAGRSDGDAAAAEIQRQRRCNRVAETVLNGNAEHHARAAAAVEIVGEQVRRKRRQDVLHRAVLVHVAGDAERRELAHLVCAGNRAAEDQDRQPAAVELADRSDQIDARRVRQPEIENEQIDRPPDRSERVRAAPQRS